MSLSEQEKVAISEAEAIIFLLISVMFLTMGGVLLFAVTQVQQVQIIAVPVFVGMSFAFFIVGGVLLYSTITTLSVVEE